MPLRMLYLPCTEEPAVRHSNLIQFVYLELWEGYIWDKNFKTSPLFNYVTMYSILIQLSLSLFFKESNFLSKMRVSPLDTILNECTHINAPLWSVLWDVHIMAKVKGTVKIGTLKVLHIALAAVTEVCESFGVTWISMLITSKTWPESGISKSKL